LDPYHRRTVTVKGLGQLLGRLFHQDDGQSADNPLFKLPALGSDELEEREPVEALNPEIRAILDRVVVMELAIQLDDGTAVALDKAAAESGKDRNEVLRLALAYGLAALGACSTAHEETGHEDRLAAELNELESEYAALKFQVFKLRDALFAEELRVAGAEGMVRTFLDQIARGGKPARHTD
jgi:hypothetical protein